MVIVASPSAAFSRPSGPLQIPGLQRVLTLRGEQLDQRGGVSVRPGLQRCGWPALSEHV